MKLDNGHRAFITVRARNKAGALRQALKDAIEAEQFGIKSIQVMTELPAEKKKRKKYFKEKKKEYDAKYLI